ncbi:MAG: redoxin domain-containing protein [Acidimicrobiia bacterium]|nr:redoxin domain-containing protein [Acidimicrobiia bacterium]
MTQMKWIVAGAGVLVLAWVISASLISRRGAGESADRATLESTEPSPSADRATAHPTPADACPADAPLAKLDYTLKGLDDVPVRLSDYKGKVVLLDFWATWCGPCKVEIPGFVELQDQYGKDGLQIIGVSVDDTLDKLKPYAAEMKMNYPVLQGLGHDDLHDEYGLMLGIPVSVIISREGKLCARHAGLTSKETFEAQIRALL